MRFLRSVSFFVFILTPLLTLLSTAHAKLNLVQEVDTNVWRGSQPKTAADFLKLKEKGIKVIINIQRKDDKLVAPEEGLAEAQGFKFIHIPLDPQARPDDATIDQIFSTLLNKENQPVYLHCTLGRDRTGLIFALYRVRIQNWPPVAAIQRMDGLWFLNPIFKKSLRVFQR